MGDLVVRVQHARCMPVPLATAAVDDDVVNITVGAPVDTVSSVNAEQYSGSQRFGLTPHESGLERRYSTRTAPPRFPAPQL